MNFNYPIFKTTIIFLFLILTLFQSNLFGNERRAAGKLFSDEEIKRIAESEKLYKEFCSGCHGAVMTAFVDREWKWGSSDEDLFKSIAEGRDDGAMPAFGEAFSDKQINDLIFTIRKKIDEIEKYKSNVTAQKEDILDGGEFNFKLVEFADGFDSPWAIDFLPNGDLIVTDKSGDLYRVNAQGKDEIYGVPDVVYSGQGGLMDVELHPNFKENNILYLTYSKENVDDDDLKTTAVSRFVLEGNKLTKEELIFEAKPYVSTRHHYGSRLAFDNDGYLFITVGDRGRRDIYPQDITTYPGKVHRVFDDGRIPEDNPFYNVPNAIKSIYSFGHRNQQGMVKHPQTGKIWTHEHGPKGGDELNIIEKGVNYGWPVISYGINYNGTTFTNLTEKEGMEQPIKFWVPSIAPCGMDFIEGDKYPGWNGNLLIGSLRFQNVVLCEIKDDDVVSEKVILEGIGRVRDVKQSPDGFIYVSVEEPGIIYKLVPVE